MTFLNICLRRSKVMPAQTMFGWARINITKPFTNIWMARHELLNSFPKVLKTFLKVMCGFLKVKKARPKVIKPNSNV